jgi:hypothetical protein
VDRLERLFNHVATPNASELGSLVATDHRAPTERRSAARSSAIRIFAIRIPSEFAPVPLAILKLTQTGLRGDPGSGYKVVEVIEADYRRRLAIATRQRRL